MNSFKISSKQVITIEMNQSLARRVAQSIQTDLLNYGKSYDPKDVEEMTKLEAEIRKHLQ